MKHSLLIVALVVASTLGTVSAAPPDLSGFSGTDQSTQLTAWLDDTCPVVRTTGLEAVGPALLAALAPKVVEKGVQALGNAIKKAAGVDNQHTTLTATTTGHFYTIDRVKGNRARNVQIGCLVLHKPSTDGDLGFYFEGNVIVSNDMTAFRVMPRLVAYGERFNPRGRTEARDLALSVRFSLPGGEDFAAATIPLGSMEVGHKATSRDLLTHTTSPWMSLRPISDGENQPLLSYQHLLGTKVEDRDARLAQELKKQALAEQLASHGPFSLTVSVTETRSINRFLASIGELVSDSQEEIGKAVSAALDREGRSEAEKAEAVEDLGLIKAYRESMRMVQVKELQLLALRASGDATPSAIAEAEGAVESAKFDANLAALQAGIRPLPFDV